MYSDIKALSTLIKERGIDKMSHGKRQDALGHLVEEHYCDVFNSSTMLARYQQNMLSELNNEDVVFKQVLDSGLFGNTKKIVSISATSNVGRLNSGGYAKTDLIVTAKYANSRTVHVPISLKQYSNRKTSVAEFSVDVIVEVVGLKDSVLIEYLRRHQTDGSAKNFTKAEKMDFGDRMLGYAEDFVRWAITGSRFINETDLRCPKLFIHLHVDKNTMETKSVEVMSVDQYMRKIMYTKDGKRKKGGYNTGLSVTCASGSKGKKIQFKA